MAKALEDRWKRVQTHMGQQEALHLVSMDELREQLIQETAERTRIESDARRWEAVATEFAHKIASLEESSTRVAPLSKLAPAVQKPSPRQALAAADEELRILKATKLAVLESHLQRAVAGGRGKPCFTCASCDYSDRGGMQPVPSSTIDVDAVLARAKMALHYPRVVQY